MKLKLVRGLPEDIAHRAQGRKDGDEDGDDEAYWYPFELCRKLIRKRQITIMRKGKCLVPKNLLPFVWFAVYEDYLEEDLERAYREKRFAMANNTFDVGLKDICDRLKIWRPSVDEEDEGEFHPLMALATKHLVERKSIGPTHAAAFRAAADGAGLDASELTETLKGGYTTR